MEFENQHLTNVHILKMLYRETVNIDVKEPWLNPLLLQVCFQSLSLPFSVLSCWEMVSQQGAFCSLFPGGVNFVPIGN